MVRGLCRAALLGLSALPNSRADAGPADVTCVGKASDQSTYTGASGAVYQVLCGIDYAGPDIAATHTPTFAGCIDACDSTPGCIDVSYVGEACYMKSKITTADERDWVWTATQITPAPSDGETNNKLSCEDNASNGNIYKATKDNFEITCGKDYAGGDLLGLGAASFEECIEACDSHAQCVNVAYIHGACYLKKEQRPAVDSVAVWGAVRKPVTTPTAPTEAPLSCEGNASNFVKYTSAKNGLYQIMCGVDFGGNDLTATSTATFEECIAACDENTECVDVSYVAPSCYLKKLAEESTAVAHVWTAKQLKPPGSVFTFPTATPMDPGSGTEESFEGPFEFDPAPIATLTPVPPPGVNMAGTGVLTPNPMSELWYNGTQSESDGSDLGPVTVRLNITYTYPSIVLDHSIWVKDVVCDAGALHGRFNTSYPFFFAQDTWQTDEDVLLITSAPTCGNDAAQNSFFFAHTISFDESSLSFEALGELVDLKDVFADLNIDFGNITAITPPPEDDSENACGAPSADTLLGLPAVACGTDFDRALDDKLGYYSAEGVDAQAVLELVAPAAEDGSVVRARGWGFFSSVIDFVVDTGNAIVDFVVDTTNDVVDFVVETAEVLVDAVVDIASTAVEFVVNTAKTVAKVTVALAVNAVKLVSFVVTGEYENSLTLPVNLGPPTQLEVDSPWGSAFKMYTFKMGADDEKFSATQAVLDNMVEDLIGSPEPEPGIEIYCVNCGARGSIKATGRINATPLSGVKEASIGISGNMYVGLYLGINAFAKWEKEFEKEIFSKGLPGWSIPGIVTLGPKISLSGKFVIGVEAEGQLLTGASLTWPAFEATLDLKNPQNSNQKGWTPNPDHVFQVNGGITATAALGLPVSLWFGIDILNGVFKEGIALVDTPAITGTAEFEIGAGTDDTSVGNDECQGVAWDITLTNEVTLEVEEGPEWALAEWASPALAEGCIGYTPGEGGGDDGGGGNGPVNPPDLPDLPDGDDGTVTCPEYDNQVYTDDKGNQWMIRCKHDYWFNEIARVRVDTMNDCMAWCAAQPNCAGTGYVRESTSEDVMNCIGRSRAGPELPLMIRNSFNSMMLMSPFEVISVVFGTVDITNYAVERWQVGNRLEINTDTVSESLTPEEDRLHGITKSIFILYRYGAETRSWVGREGSGILTIRPGPVSSAPGSSMLVPDWPTSDPWIRIIDICYGASQIRDRSVWDKIYLDAYHGRTTSIVNEVFGDTWYSIEKSAVVWYRDTRSGEDGPLYLVTGLEGDDFRLMGRDGNFRRQLALPRQAGEGSNSTVGSGLYANSTLPSNTTTSLGFAPATVRDTTGSLELYPAINGNLFLAPVGTTEELDLLTNNTVLDAMTLTGNSDVPYLINSDSTDRLLHYFPSEVSSLGASRLRLAPWDKLPVGSRLVHLAPITVEAGSTGPVLVAIDGSGGGGDYLLPVMCAIEGQLNKVFLVKDTSEAALKALEAEDLKFVLTGGQASQCGPLALVASVVEKEV